MSERLADTQEATSGETDVDRRYREVAALISEKLGEDAGLVVALDELVRESMDEGTELDNRYTETFNQIRDRLSEGEDRHLIFELDNLVGERRFPAPYLSVEERLTRAEEQLDRIEEKLVNYLQMRSLFSAVESQQIDKRVDELQKG